MVLLPVLFLLISACVTCICNPLSVNTYQWRDDVTGEPVTCERCPPGTYVIRHCSKGKSTQCAECPDLHYTAYWNYVERCLYCSVFCTDEQYEKVKCSPKQNRVCECKDGFHWNNGFCERHRVCPPGEGVVANGTAQEDVRCAPCSEGYFSSKPSSTERCQKHSQCQTGERAIPGSSKQDTFCTTCNISTNDMAQDRRVCDQAVIDYTALQILPAKKLTRLKRAVKRMFQESTEKEDMTLSELLVFCSNQKREPQQPFVYVMLEILRNARLYALEYKVKKWFLDEISPNPSEEGCVTS